MDWSKDYKGTRAFYNFNRHGISRIREFWVKLLARIAAKLKMIYIPGGWIHAVTEV